MTRHKKWLVMAALTSILGGGVASAQGWDHDRGDRHDRWDGGRHDRDHDGWWRDGRGRWHRGRWHRGHGRWNRGHWDRGWHRGWDRDRDHRDRDHHD